MNLYKYRELNEFTRESLEENYFWAPSKETLNDPCECYYSTESYNTFMDFTSLIAPQINKNELHNQFDSIQDMIKSSGIFSLSKSYNISSLWASYAQGHTGICIEYDLEDLIGKNKGLYQCFDVMYSDTPPDIGVEDISNDFLLQKMIGTKHFDWDKEQEFRIVCDNQGKNHHRSDAIRSIIFGLKTPDESKNELMNLLSNRNIKFKQLVNDGKSYGFHIQNIVNPFDKKVSLNGSTNYENLIPSEAHIKDDHKVFRPYLYKVASFMESYPDCIEVADMDFSQISTTENPIIYVNFKEKDSIFPYSKKIFRIKDMD
ncbi:DUF2971 domain-containing protein [Psychrobacter vallis]|uniref:DUF2971 domain-containing protein n=1 Tax=Psychrobacter vallis TaxID=248451 RepID=UPI00191850D0|nr:DUF2971 domain-containing protein [Psychrobacter vallis]